MKFYTADNHFGHANIIRFCNRPFATIEEMDKKMIEDWNKKISNEDDVYIAGDLIFKSSDPEYYLSLLNGKKHLAIGNHDAWLNRQAKYIKNKGNPTLRDYFVEVDKIIEVKGDAGERIIISHYPMFEWNAYHYGSFMVFGHIHNSRNPDYWNTLRKQERLLNAGVDINHFAPVTFEELKTNNEIYRWQEADK